MALVLCGGARAQEPVVGSGLFGSLTLAVNGKAVSGVFTEARGENGPGGAPQFSCIFLLRGALEGASATVETWFPGEAERISGVLTFTPEGAAVTLTEDHGGCPMTTGTMAGSPYVFPRTAETTAEGWRGVGLVTTKRAVLRPEPVPTPKRAPYLVEFDAVVILERREGWAKARYLGGKTPVTDWLPDSDLAVVAP